MAEIVSLGGRDLENSAGLSTLILPAGLWEVDLGISD